MPQSAPFKRSMLLDHCENNNPWTERRTRTSDESGRFTLIARWAAGDENHTSKQSRGHETSEHKRGNAFACEKRAVEDLPANAAHSWTHCPTFLPLPPQCLRYVKLSRARASPPQIILRLRLRYLHSPLHGLEKEAPQRGHHEPSCNMSLAHKMCSLPAEAVLGVIRQHMCSTPNPRKCGSSLQPLAFGQTKVNASGSSALLKRKTLWCTFTIGG